jgi:phage terminase large subunit
MLTIQLKTLMTDKGIQVNWPKWRTLINDKFVPLTKCTDRYVILYGSRGSSKSDYVAKQLIYNCLKHKYFKFILYRKNYNTIQESSYENLKQTIKTLGLESLFTFKVSPLQILCVNGNKFLARGGDDADSLKSIKDPTGVWYEEDIPNESDFATITLTIRSGKADRLQEYFTINPEVEEDYTDNWFWKRFFKDQTQLSYRTSTTVEVEGHISTYGVTVHHSVYQDNRWLPDIVKALIEGYKTTNTYLYSVYAKGLWTMKETGGNFYKLFQRSRNTAETRYDPTLALHASFDFNVNPYITCCIWQIVGKKAMQIQEICLETPNNRTENICRELIKYYPGHTAGLFVYGDPSGKQEDTRTEVGYNDFVIIMRALAQYRPTQRVAKAAPPVTMRGNFINAVFAHNEQGLEFIIGNNCSKSIADYMYLKEAADGTKAKIKEKNKDTGVTYEKYGHCFVGETLIQTSNGPKRIDSIEIGDMVLTRRGYKKVKNTFYNGIREVHTYQAGQRKITCTPDHQIWTKEFGFITIGQLIQPITLCIFEKNEICKKKLTLSRLTDLSLGTTQMQKVAANGSTIQAGSSGKVLGKKQDYIGTFGCWLMATSQKVITFITLMKILLTTTSQTWNAKRQKNIFTTMASMLNLKLTGKNSSVLQEPESKPLSGMDQKKEGSGIQITIKKQKQQRKRISNALNVGLHSWALSQQENSVQENANRGIICELIELPGSGMRQEPVCNVQRNFKLTDGQKQRRVQSPVQQRLEKVYDIEVEDCHEYFANGILVHNCSDANDYFICYAFQNEFLQYQKGGFSSKMSRGRTLSKNTY